MRYFSLFILFGFFIFFYSCKQEKTNSPNVIYILTDDLGYGDLSCYGQKKLSTPNIDRLANEGILFTNHYSGNTVCSPSRAVLMTGQDPGHVHCRGNMPTEKMGALDSTMVTLPRLFKNAGYATGAFGKWGLGITSNEGEENPLTHGFDHFTGWKSQTIAHTYYPSSIVRDGQEIPLDSGTYVHDFIMEDAFNFIRESVKENKPFFCYIPTAIPHAAMHAPKELHEKWRKKLPQFDDKIGRYGAGPGEVCPPVQNPIAGFGAMMEHLDDQVGELLSLLEQMGIDDNTLVMFSSDNGSHHEGGHDPEYWDSNGPLRGHKRDMYEGGLRAPFLARWPNVIKQGTSSDLPSAFWDMLPTMADIIDQEKPVQTNGISFLPTLKGESGQEEHNYLYWEFRQGNHQFVKGKAIRLGDWKAVINYPRSSNEQSLPGEIELYDLSNDLGEERNIADQHPEIIKKVESVLLNY